LAEIYKLEYLETSIDKHLAYLYSLQKWKQKAFILITPFK
jgi:hypothetical protein